RDLGEAELREPLHLVDAERGRAVAHLAPGPGGGRAEDALVRTAARGHDARVAVEGEVARERDELARGRRQPVEILLQRARVRADERVAVAALQPAHAAHVHPPAAPA